MLKEFRFRSNAPVPRPNLVIFHYLSNRTATYWRRATACIYRANRMLLLPVLVTLALPAARAFPKHELSSSSPHQNADFKTHEGAGKCVSDSHDGHVHSEPEVEMAAFFDMSQTRLAWPDTPKNAFDGVPSPPLEIQPLVVSGPSSNRVDLVFFSDGCAHLFNSQQLILQLCLVQICKRSKKNSSKTPCASRTIYPATRRSIL